MDLTVRLGGRKLGHGLVSSTAFRSLAIQWDEDLDVTYMSSCFRNILERLKELKFCITGGTWI